MPEKKIQIVVVGGGAGGLALVAKLGRKFGRKNYDIILVDRSHTHIWKPLLHEVAAGSLDANLDEVGYRAHCSRWGYRFFYGEFKDIDRQNREIIIAPLIDDDGSTLMEEHRIRYDYLVLAVGSVTNDFGTKGADQYCMRLDTREDADRFRNRLLNHCLRTSRKLTANPSGQEYVDIAIVGAGATGVELSAELFNSAAALRYYGLEVFDESKLRVTLIEAGPRVVPALPEDLSNAVMKELHTLGVRVKINTAITEVTESSVITADGEEIKASLKVWAAGVRAPNFLREIAGLESDRSGRLVVLPTLQTTRDEHILAIGDCASYTKDGENRPVPPRAQAAHQMAAVAYKNICALIEKKPLTDFEYHDHGSLVSLSRFSTVGSLMGNIVGGKLAVEGRLARLAYISLYRMHLLAIHGWFSGIIQIIASMINRVIRPRLKLH